MEIARALRNDTAAWVYFVNIAKLVIKTCYHMLSHPRLVDEKTTRLFKTGMLIDRNVKRTENGTLITEIMIKKCK